MLKFIFATLLLINAVLLAMQTGLLDTLMPSGREPQRLKSQINPDKIRIVPQTLGDNSTASAIASISTSAPASTSTPALAAAVVPPAAALPTAAPALAPQPAPAATVPTAAKKILACVDVGNFTLAESKRFESQLASLSLPVNPVRRESKEQSSHMVWIEPQDGKEGAEKRAAELRSKGFDDFYILQEEPKRYGISLGVFRTAEAAQGHLAKLVQQGVRGANISEHKMPLTRVSYLVRGLDEKNRAALDRKRKEFPRHEVRDCT